MLEFLKARAIRGVEVVQGGAYLRTIQLRGRRGVIDVRHDSAQPALSLRIDFPDSRALLQIVDRTRSMFDLAADPSEVGARLSQNRTLAELVRARPGLRIPGSWDGFEIAVRTLLARNRSHDETNRLLGDVALRLGSPCERGAGAPGRVFPTASVLCKARLDEFTGASAREAASVRALALATVSGKIAFDGSVSPGRLTQRLLQIVGFSRQECEYAIMRALGEPDALPADPGALLAAAEAAAMEQTLENVRPWRAYAALYLLLSRGDAQAF